MPIYHHFYIECRKPEGWVVPPDFKPEPWTFECDQPFGEFAWAHSGRHWLALFFGKDQLFRMRPGPPIGEPHAALFKGLRQYGPDVDLRILSRRG